MPAARPLPQTLGELRTSSQFPEACLKTRTVKDEMRGNLIARLQAGETLFPGIVGYEDTVIPQIVNAVLSKQNLILLGLRGQAKIRILRALTALLDEQMPYLSGCEIRDNPYYTPLQTVPRADCGAGRCYSDRVFEPRRSLRGEAGDAGRDRRRPGGRYRPDQGGARGAGSFE
jgi:hypothetical protein